MRKLWFALLAFFFLGSAAHAAPQIFYRLITLKPLAGYTDGIALAVNNNNEAVGYSTRESGGSRPTYWGPGNNYVPRDIGSFGGTYGQACGINDGGYVVGTGYSASGASEAFLWDPTSGLMRKLDPDTGSTAEAINIHGVAAGSFYGHAGLFQLGQPAVNLGGGFNSGAYGINESGLVVGFENSDRTSGVMHPVIWDHGTWYDLTPGVTANYSSRATAVNNDGQVTGLYYSPVGQMRGFIWDKFKGLREFGTLGGTTSWGNGINGKGEVVGMAYAEFGFNRAFIWREGQGMTDLNTLIKLGINYTAMEAFGINDQGAIVGYGQDFFNSHETGFLLLPIKSISWVISTLLLY